MNRQALTRPRDRGNLTSPSVTVAVGQGPDAVAATVYICHMGSPQRTTQKDLALAKKMSRRNLQYILAVKRAGCDDLSDRIAGGRLSVRAAHREMRRRLQDVPHKPVIVDFSPEELEALKTRAAKQGCTLVKWIRGALGLLLQKDGADPDAWYTEPLTMVEQFPMRRSGEGRRCRQYSSAVERAGWGDLAEGMKFGYLSVWAAYCEKERRLRSGRDSVVVLFSPNELELIRTIARSGETLSKWIGCQAVIMCISSPWKKSVR